MPGLDPEILKLLCCPETHQKLAPAGPELVEQINRQIRTGLLRNRAGQTVRAGIDAGLVRADGKFLYAIRQDIPIMLIDEAIPLPT